MTKVEFVSWNWIDQGDKSNYDIRVVVEDEQGVLACFERDAFDIIDLRYELDSYFECVGVDELIDADDELLPCDADGELLPDGKVPPPGAEAADNGSGGD